MAQDPPECSDLERALGVCPTQRDPTKGRLRTMIWHPNQLSCFMRGDTGTIRARKMMLFVIYTILIVLVGIIVFPTIHEFGHLAVSGLRGRMIWDFTDLRNIRIYAVVFHSNILTPIGGVMFELFAAMLFGWVATRRGSFVFAILGIVEVISPTVYMVAHFLDATPPMDDFASFIGFHWGFFLFLLAIAYIVNIRMVVRNLRVVRGHRDVLCVQ